MIKGNYLTSADPCFAEDLYSQLLCIDVTNPITVLLIGDTECIKDICHDFVNCFCEGYLYQVRNNYDREQVNPLAPRLAVYFMLSKLELSP